MKSAKEIFLRSFHEGFASTEVDLKTVVAALTITAVLSLYIFLVYRVITRKTFYSKNFNIALVGVAIITAGIIVTIQSNLVISLGMVGALSIVRFRTAVKDPIDLMFLFWAISTGIICGAGLGEFAVALAVILTVAVLVLEKLPVARAPMILIVNADAPEREEAVMAAVKGFAPGAAVKSRNVTAASLDLTVELKTAEAGELVRALVKQDGVRSASLLSHEGEVTF